MIPRVRASRAILIRKTAILVRPGKRDAFGLKRSRSKTSASGVDDSRDQPSQDDSCGSSSLRRRSTQPQSMARKAQLTKQTPEKNSINFKPRPPVAVSAKN